MSALIKNETCAKCFQIIRNESRARCRICEGIFHYRCSDIANENYVNTADASQQIIFNCGDCVSASNGLTANVSLLTDELKELPINKGPVFGMRHMQVFLLFLEITVIYISRLNIGVSVVAMTNAKTTNPDFPEFDWTEKQISFIISTFYWGYLSTQFLGGFLCKRFGVKMVMGWATFTSALCSVMTPTCVTWGGWQCFCAIRLVQGSSQGMVFPGIYAHLAKWCPKNERNRLGAFTHTGLDCGTVLAMGVTGLIAYGPLGWPGISYVSGGICFVWCILWYIFAANNPCESKFITEDEKHYIESSMAHEEGFHKKNIPIPWKAILTSVPFAALVVARCAEKWGMPTLEAQIPSYFNGVLNMSIKSNALFSALPFLASWGMSYVYLISADIVQRKTKMSLTTLRRTFNTIALWLPAMGLTAIGFLDEDKKNVALALMTISVALNCGNTIGSSLNIIDLSPNHSGVLFSIINTAASCMPLISPLTVGIIVTDVHNRSEWQIVFAIAAAVFFFGNLFYISFCSAETQPWDADDFMEERDTELANGVHGNNMTKSNLKTTVR